MSESNLAFMLPSPQTMLHAKTSPLHRAAADVTMRHAHLTRSHGKGMDPGQDTLDSKGKGFAALATVCAFATKMASKKGKQVGRCRRMPNQLGLVAMPAKNITAEDLGWQEEDLAVDGVRGQIQRALERGGTGGKALQSRRPDPSKAEVFAAIPRDCFKKNTALSLLYAASSVLQVGTCAFLAWKYLPLTAQMWPLWVLYAIVCGTCATGAWVVAHECGHDAFCDQKWLQSTVGYILHSAMLAPYYSWQRSHAVHHAKTNHLTEGETHVPKVRSSPRSWEKMMKVMGVRTPVAMFRLALRLLVGWPAYLLFGASGGPKYGRTSHFIPYNSGEKELFPGKHKKKVWKADVGVIACLAALWYWGSQAGVASVLALYAGPLTVANAWLVIYTWLQHTDVDIPHYGEDSWTWARGAFATVDRPYGRIIDFLHHRIGSTHVAHHVNCTIPHYKAVKATEALKKAFPGLYLYDPTPIPLAACRVVKNCFRVQRVPGPDGMYVFSS